MCVIKVFYLLGKPPSPSKGTVVRVPVDGTGAVSHGHAHYAPDWKCKVTNNKQNSLELQITPPPGE